VRALIGVIAPALVAVSTAVGSTAVEPPAGAELAELSQPPARSTIASQRIYFVMTDRYANGDPSNDRGGATGSRKVTGYDPTDPGWFHGGDFAGLTGDCTSTRTGLARLKSLGFTSIWVTPPFGQKWVQGGSAAYHGYWALDLTSVDRHLGTNADFGRFVDCAHGLGLKVILDVVTNHTADVIQLATSAFVAPPAPPHAAFVPPAERDVKRPVWLNDPANYHNRGNISGSCDQTCLELGDFAGLDDLATERQQVLAGLADVYAGWVRRYKLDGFRVDTARHVNPEFFGAWVPRILAAAREVGVNDFELFGEAFIRDSVALAPYVRDRGLPNVLDFPLQEPAVRYAAGVATSRAIVNRLADDDYFATPGGGVAHTPPTFLGNHDVGRAALNIIATGASRARLLDRVLLGYSLLYLLRGAPVIYYGDEVGMIGGGGDKEARGDLFATQVAAWRTEARVGGSPIGTGSSFDVDSPVAAGLRQLNGLRARHGALSTGATIVRRSSGKVLAVSRIDGPAAREYLALFNTGTTPARVTFATSTPLSGWTRLLGRPSAASSTRTGALTLRLPAVSASLLRATRRLPAARPSKPVVTGARDGLSGLWRVSARVGGRAPVSVAFAVKRADEPWRRVAIDDSPPYRAFLTQSEFRPGESVSVVAVARSLDGRIAVSLVRTQVPRR
jgi:glycosidase